MTRLLLVDDHTVVREGLRALLEAYGHAVVGEASEPRTAMAMIDQLAPDMVLLDLQLDGHSGFELMAEMQRVGGLPPVLVLTMSLQRRDVSEALRLGARGYLRKDAPRDELLAAVRTIAAGGSHASVAVLELNETDVAPSPDDVLAALSPRERQIIAMVVQGRSSASIGEQLGLSRKTVDTYRSRLMIKLQVPDLPALVRLAVGKGLVDPG